MKNSILDIYVEFSDEELENVVGGSWRDAVTEAGIAFEDVTYMFLDPFPSSD